METYLPNIGKTSLPGGAFLGNQIVKPTKKISQFIFENGAFSVARRLLSAASIFGLASLVWRGGDLCFVADSPVGATADNFRDGAPSADDLNPVAEF